MMINTTKGYVNASSIESVYESKPRKGGGFETPIVLKGSESIDYALGEVEDILLACATVIPAYPGFNLALAWEHNGEWGLFKHPVIGWAIQDRHDPEPIAAGMSTNIAGERALISPDGQAYTFGGTFESVADWLESLKETAKAH